MEQINSKILLFGEYAILHQGMALVIPYDKYNGHFEFPTNLSNSEEREYARQSNEYLKKFCDFVASRTNEKFVLEVKQFEKELENGLFFRSNIPQGYGLGSSGAIVAAIVLRYLKQLKNFKDELKLKLSDLKTNLGDLEAHFHGVSSGLDPLSIFLNQPILYKNSSEIVPTELKTHSVEQKNVIFLLDTELPRHSSHLIEHFNKIYKEDGCFKEKFDRYVIDDNNQTIDNFLSGDTSNFYKSLFNLSKFQLEEMKIFFPEELQKKMIEGLDNGDYFLKLCGAGGGGFILGFTSEWEKTKEQLKEYKLEEIHSF